MSALTPAPDSLVHHVAADLCGCSGPGTPPFMGVAAFPTSALTAEHEKNPEHPPRPPMQPALLRGMNWIKSS